MQTLKKELAQIRGSERLVSLAGILLVATALSACSQSDKAIPQSPAAAMAAVKSTNSPFTITATIKELMDSTVDPSADGVWDSVAVYSTADGVTEHQPRTEEEWRAVRRHAITLIESMNLVVMPARNAAPAGTRPGLGELTPPEIDHRIAPSREVFAGFANGVRSTALKALEAIDRKDTAALLTAGGDIDEACEACHVTFWYPNQQTPSK